MELASDLSKFCSANRTVSSNGLIEMRSDLDQLSSYLTAKGYNVNISKTPIMNTFSENKEDSTKGKLVVGRIRITLKHPEDESRKAVIIAREQEEEARAAYLAAEEKAKAISLRVAQESQSLQSQSQQLSSLSSSSAAAACSGRRIVSSSSSSSRMVSSKQVVRTQVVKTQRVVRTVQTVKVR